LIAPATATRVVDFTHPFWSSAIAAEMADVRSSGVSAFHNFRTVVVLGAAARVARAGRRDVVGMRRK
jgi:hypothetical protein